MEDSTKKGKRAGKNSKTKDQWEKTGNFSPTDCVKWKWWYRKVMKENVTFDILTAVNITIIVVCDMMAYNFTDR
jgi:hypothetical protein